MELLPQHLTVRPCFQAEANSTGALHDAAVNLAVTSADERQKVLEDMVWHLHHS